MRKFTVEEGEMMEKMVKVQKLELIDKKRSALKKNCRCTNLSDPRFWLYRALI